MDFQRFSRTTTPYLSPQDKIEHELRTATRGNGDASEKDMNDGVRDGLESVFTILKRGTASCYMLQSASSKAKEVIDQKQAR